MDQIKQDILCEKLLHFFKALYNPQLVTRIQTNILQILGTYVTVLQKQPYEISHKYKIEGDDFNHSMRYKNAMIVYELVAKNLSINSYDVYCDALRTLPLNQFVYVKGIYEEILKY